MNVVAEPSDRDVRLPLSVWPFCTNSGCVLHVRSGDPGVVGQGEWAVRPDGVVLSRRIVDGRMLCDACARQSRQDNGGVQ